MGNDFETTGTVKLGIVVFRLEVRNYGAAILFMAATISSATRIWCLQNCVSTVVRCSTMRPAMGGILRVGEVWIVEGVNDRRQRSKGFRISVGSEN
jgi:hypothetical protein